MRLIVNGEPRELPDGMTVSALLHALGLHPRRVAVERNRRLVPRARFEESPLANGDCLEIVTLVGGG